MHSIYCQSKFKHHILCDTDPLNWPQLQILRGACVHSHVGMRIVIHETRQSKGERERERERKRKRKMGREIGRDGGKDDSSYRLLV